MIIDIEALPAILSIDYDGTLAWIPIAPHAPNKVGGICWKIHGFAADIVMFSSFW